MAKVSVKGVAAKKPRYQQEAAAAITTTTSGGDGGVTIASKAKDTGKKKRRFARKEKWSTYIHKLLKTVTVDRTMSSKAMEVMNSFVGDTFEKIMHEASKLVHMSGHTTLNARDIQTACQLVLKGELARHAVSSGASTLSKYKAK